MNRRNFIGGMLATAFALPLLGHAPISSPPPPEFAGPFIFDSHDPKREWSGSIATILIFDRKLNGEEVAAIYHLYNISQ